eukprot:TRINITY_DN7978_c0_g1_i1.p1 TRINITY_DN7978_c0_g1~~TRINITY_DN7978_c0_g1_i1.p1  ORF type:complete len:326 (+),score=46.62 TRINITY_DN7978_c0_g1_i1:50-1027(+)
MWPLWVIGLLVGLFLLFVVVMELREKLCHAGEETMPIPLLNESPLPGPDRKLLNFRSLGGLRTTDGRRLRNDRLFRSADPHRISPEFREWFLEQGIRTIIDLRSARELLRPLSGKRSWLEEHFTIEPDAKDKTSAADDLRLRCKESADASGKAGRRIIQINVLKQDIGLAVFRSVHLLQKLRILFFLVRRTRAQLEWLLTRTVDGLGFVWLYKHIIDDRKPEIRNVLELVANPSSGPVLVHCAAGKDRTGVFIAVLLLAVGVPPHDVVADYSESQRCFASVHGVYMSAALHHIHNHYGSVNAFFKAAGITPELQAQLREKLLEPE